MKVTGKIRVAVLFGGRSAEHEISLKSAANVIQFLDPSRFEVVPVGIDKEGNWFLGNDIFAKSIAHQTVPSLADQQNSAWFTPEWVNKAIKNQHQALASSVNNQFFDVIFPAVHGTFCEDGTLQGLLELANLPYVGCGVLGSAIGMDKDIAKRLAREANIAVAPYLTIRQDQWVTTPQKYIDRITEELHYPVFVKPANTGSSIGINKVKTVAELNTAVNVAFQFDTKILVEKALDVYELEIAALQSLEPNTDPIVSVVGEIKPHHEFYSYDAKYLDENGATLLIPASVSADICAHAQSIAKQIFMALECEGMARIDLFLDKKTNQLYFNEINTIPGFTQISMYPKLMEASGVSYSDLLAHLIELAIKRFNNKNRLRRNYIA